MKVGDLVWVRGYSMKGKVSAKQYTVTAILDDAHAVIDVGFTMKMPKTSLFATKALALKGFKKEI